MKNLNIKKIILISLSIFFTNFIYSLPAVNSLLADSSGEYVYYSDKTFSDKSASIVGFIYYDDENYGMRYFSPAVNNSKSSRLEKDISVYIKLNSQNPNIEFLGERIIGATSPEDADIVNYLHDLFYEFTERRQKITFPENTKKFSVKQNYLQFGGNVNFDFNIYIPIFNIESIKSADGKILFQALTCGKLSNSQDSSFENFKSIDGLPKDKKRNFKSSSKSKKIQVNFESDFNAIKIDGETENSNLNKKSSGKFSDEPKDKSETQKIIQSLTLDENWKQGMENLWLLGDYAILSLNIIQNPQALNQNYFSDVLIRRFIQSTNQSYALFPYLNLEKKNDVVKITNVFYQPQSENVTRDIKILTKVSEQSFAFLTLTVFDNVYQNNKKYFTSILNTYKLN